MNTECEEITRDMTIQDMFAKFAPKAQKLAQELSRAGLNCVGCSASTWETLESGMLRHGYGEEAIVALLNRLNDIAKKPTQAAQSGIALTERAAEQFKHVSKLEGKEGWALRFDEEPAGCSGFEYVLGFSEKPTEADAVYTSHGVEIHVPKIALCRLEGCEINYVDGLHGGFEIDNPNARNSCGCGSSHGYN
jgi:iron-sulfur cluster assembly accessory protein